MIKLLRMCLGRRTAAAAVLIGLLLAALPLSGQVQDDPAPAIEAVPAEFPPAEAAAEPDTVAELRRTAIPQSPMEVVEVLGYLFTIPFVAASVIAVWFAIERLIVLRRARVIPRPFVERFLQHLEQGHLEPEQALRLCEENGSPVAAVFAHGIRKWGKPSVEVEQAIIDGGERQVSQLRQHLRLLNAIATITPLIGLLGTVIGMIQAFNKIAVASAMGQHEELAVGIALALLTTAVGLIIAIPALTLYMYFAGRVDSLVMEMDTLAQNVVHLISAEGLQSSAVRPPRPVSRRAAATAEPKEKKVV